VGDTVPAPVRVLLEEVTVAIDGHTEPSSTTLATAGGYVFVVATTLPEHAIGLTSSYLGQFGGAIAASHLHLGPAQHERIAQRLLAPEQARASVAGACLLDHAAELQIALAERTRSSVAVDVGVAALARAAEAWGPPGPDG
jgi:hypothetical protein